MITFVSTFPPIICGIATYTKYILDHLPPNFWRVVSFDLKEFSTANESLPSVMSDRVDYCLSFSNLTLPNLYGTNVVWLQHAFGIWGERHEHFLEIVQQAKAKGMKVAASFHTIHFQSPETPFGLTEQERQLLSEALPLLDVATVFTDGARSAVIEAFPQFREKVTVLRHGVHVHPRTDKKEARERFYNHLINQAPIPEAQKEELRKIRNDFLSETTILLGNYGFITQDKDPCRLYELGRLVRNRLPNYKILTMFAGIIQGTKNNNLHSRLPVLNLLRECHDGKENFFFYLYIPEDIFAIAIRALDFAVFWCSNATQSGRMAHAQGAGTVVVGRDLEGVGETLRLSGMPAARSIEELADMIAEMVLNPALRKEAEMRAWQYVTQYCFENQAKKHLVVEKALVHGEALPLLDSCGATVTNHDTSQELKPTLRSLLDPHYKRHSEIKL